MIRPPDPPDRPETPCLISIQGDPEAVLDLTIDVVIIINFDEGQGYGLKRVPVLRVGQNGL
jgi:hypothetical protein